MINRKVYLTEVDIHRYPEPLSTEELRQQIFFMCLLWDNVVISDSILNNNPNLRPLFLPKVGKTKRRFNVLMDFNHLIKKGYIRPAMRENIRGFKELRKEHKTPVSVPRLPTRDYSKKLDRLSPEIYWERFSLKEVEACFKNNLLKIFSSKAPWQNFQIPKEACQSILSFIQSKGNEPIFYREIRDLMRHPENYNLTNKSSEQIKRHFNAIDKCISDAYRFNVPAVLGIDSEATCKTLPWWVQLGTPPTPSPMVQKIGTPEYNLRPTWVFDKEVIGEIPADALDGTKDWKSYKELMKHLNNIDLSKPPEDFFKDIVTTWEEYTIKLESHLRKALSVNVVEEAERRANKPTNRWLNRIERVASAGLVALSIQLPPWAAIPILGVEVYFGYRSHRDWKNNIKEIERLSRLIGKPIISIK